MVDIPPTRNGPDESEGLADAEAIESYEGRTGNWSPNLTNGEALSRAMSFEAHPELARDPGFSTDPMQQWWADGHKDYINGNPDYDPKGGMMKGPDGKSYQMDQNFGLQTADQASDMSPDSNGAGTLFLDYMHDKLGYSWSRIIHAKGETIGEKYQNLTGKSGQQGFQNFLKALPTTKDSKGDTMLNLPPDGNPFKKQGMWSKIEGFWG